MAQERKIVSHFDSQKEYFENSLGREFLFTATTGPYEYLLGALSGCFYRTLVSFERKGSWEKLEIAVTGIKRETVPTTLEKTILDITVFNANVKDEFADLARMASEACSIFQTISKVSEMKINIKYED